jgi:hypothetical protein
MADKTTTTETAQCELCGCDFERRVGGRGARKLHCSDEHRVMASVFRVADRHAAALFADPRVTDEARARLRSQLFRIATKSNAKPYRR